MAAVKYPYRTQLAAPNGNNPFLTDPGYLAALAAEQAGSQQADASLKAAREQAIVQFGGPELAQTAGIQVDPLTAAMAATNTRAGSSTLAGLQRTRDTNQQNTLDTLAAHGMLASGQTGYATTQNQQAYGSDLASALQTAVGGLNTALGTDVAAKQDLHSGVVQALTSAYNTDVSNPALWGAAGNMVGAPGGATYSDANTGGYGPVTRGLARPSPPRAPASGLVAAPPLVPSRPLVMRNVRAG